MTHHASTATVLLIVSALTVACSSSTTAPALGALCTSTSDCAKGLTCDGNDMPSVGTCSTSCTSDTDCTKSYPNSECIGAGRCVTLCKTDADCSEGHVCGDAKWCKRATCSSDSQCWNYKCDTTAQKCRTTCATAADCQFGRKCDPALPLCY